MPNIASTPLARALAVALAILAGAATADPPHTRAAREFRDWRLTCAGEGCAVRSQVTGADGSAVLTAEAAGRDSAGSLAFRTPLPLFLPDGLTLTLGDAPPHAVAWRTCHDAGCEAVAPLDADLLAALRRERTAEVTLTLVDGVRVRLPLSLIGFTAAWEALATREPVSPP